HLLDTIAERFTGFRVQMTENNRRQAYLPEAAILIENAVGTAPAFAVEHEGRVIISLPGVPREMKFLMTEKVIPYLRARFDLGSSVIKAKVLRTAGIGESTLDAQIGEKLLQMSNPTVGLAAHAGQVDVRITAKAASVEEADQMIAVIEDQLQQRIGPYIYGINDEKIQEVLARLLRAHQATLAISETGVGNAISQAVEKVEQGGNIISHTENYAHPDELRLALDIPATTPLRTLAEQAAERLYRKSGATAAIVIVSYPTATENADVEGSTALAVYTANQVRSRAYGFGGQSDLAAAWGISWSLSTLWRILKEQVNDA
ncbi:MAG TPA: hypothetical protein VHO69_00450, partial [Phototrophicaceae bacterium]|nr:hypothetical protein [Phototrophicaceae bacterium]